MTSFPLRLQTLLEERSAPDDLAASIFEEGALTVVLRFRVEDGRVLLIADDGKGSVATDVTDSPEMFALVLPKHSDADTVGYEEAREIICRAFTRNRTG